MTIKEKLLSLISISDSGCWLWTAARRDGRYGVVRSGGRVRYVHRVAYEEFIGEIPNGLFVCHRCDVMHCINPDHLFIGTHRDNMVDSVSKGRMTGNGGWERRHGHNSKLVRNEVDLIRLLYKHGVSMPAIAKMFNISRSNTSNIIHYKTWK